MNETIAQSAFGASDASRRSEPRWHAITILLFAAALAWSPIFFLQVPGDYPYFLLPWYRHIAFYGPIGAFAHPFSNYTPPYLYLLSLTTLVGGPPVIIIKCLSAIGAAWTVYAAYRLLSELRYRWAVEGALALLLLPTIFINVPAFGQADMFWVAPCLLAIAAACRKQNLAMTLWAGVAFAFKAQAIFFAPFVIAILVNRRSPWWYWAIPPIVYAVAMLPAWLAGWPAYDLLMVYVRQAQWVPPDGLRFVSTASNPWALFRIVDYELAIRSYWIGLMAAAVAAAVYVACIACRDLSKRQMVAAAALSAAMLPFLLPEMHERFFALAEVVAFCWALTERTRNAIAAAILLQLQLLLAYFGWLCVLPQLPIGGAILTTAALWLLGSSIRAHPDVFERA